MKDDCIKTRRISRTQNPVGRVGTLQRSEPLNSQSFRPDYKYPACKRSLERVLPLEGKGWDEAGVNLKSPLSTGRGLKKLLKKGDDHNNCHRGFWKRPVTG